MAPLNNVIVTPDEILGALARQWQERLCGARYLSAPQAQAVFAELIEHDLPAALCHARASGLSAEEIAAALAPVDTTFSAAGLARRARLQARGYPGDFETIEYLLAGRPEGEPGSLGWMFDSYLLNSAMARQHHNKIAHQAALIETVLAPRDRQPCRILLIASGGAADLRQVDPDLLLSGDRIVLNDVEPDALAYALQALPTATAANVVTVPGNALRKSAELAADHGPYDLVLAGGLFDYLPQRHAQSLIRAVLTRLCKHGGIFYFSNIAAGQPVFLSAELAFNWPLIERTEADIETLVSEAASDLVECLSVHREETGLTLLAEIRRVGGEET